MSPRLHHLLHLGELLVLLHHPLHVGGLLLFGGSITISPPLTHHYGILISTKDGP